MQFLADMGVPKSAVVSDVYGLEPDLLAMVSKPVYALLLLYPLTEKVKLHLHRAIGKLCKGEFDCTADA